MGGVYPARCGEQVGTPSSTTRTPADRHFSSIRSRAAPTGPPIRYGVSDLRIVVLAPSRLFSTNWSLLVFSGARMISVQLSGSGVGSAPAGGAPVPAAGFGSQSRTASLVSA